MAILLSGGLFYLSAEENDPWRRKARLETPDRMAALQRVENNVPGWPPQVGDSFPEISFTDHNGNPFSLSSLKGKPAIVEIIAMSCAGCQAFSGGNRFGGFNGFPAQAGLRSIEEYLKQYSGGVDLFGPQINFIQIIIYNLNLQAPAKEQLAAWRTHFKLDKPNTYVVTGGEALANKASFRMIPGFILLDSDHIVRSDSTGHTPKNNLYTELLPAVQKYVR